MEWAPQGISRSNIIFETVRSKILVWYCYWSLWAILTKLILMTYFGLTGLNKNVFESITNLFK